MVTIKGIEFDFSKNNARHLKRLRDAEKAYLAKSEDLQARREPGLEGRIREIIALGELIGVYIDTILGEGAADHLGIDREDSDVCLNLLREVLEAIRQ